MPTFRLIPSIDELVARPALIDAAQVHGRARVVRAARQAADDLRAALRPADSTPPDPGRAGATHSPATPRVAGPAVADAPATAEAATAWLEARIMLRLDAATAPSLSGVVNATGVILHTNLGRAPIAAAALAHAARVAGGYSNLEYDVAAGLRGHRHVHAERLLCDLTGAEAALVVNNNAAATLLVLAALASGREVIVSRGELVEIGGGFRVPDVMTQSGALLREVGTTNRTRASDYAAAIGAGTGALLRVHPSNFRIEGFVDRPSLEDLAALARRFDLPLFEDLGSGWLGLDDVDTPPALAGEPTVIGSLRAGADLVAFSGDKLLGGPQAGIVLGRRDWIDRARRHPLMRALRADKLTYATLETTLGLWAQPARRGDIPVYRMLTMALAEIDGRARRLAAALRGVPGLSCGVIDGASTVGGGSAPESALPTRLVALHLAGVSATSLAERLRRARHPVVGRIANDDVVLDPRTIGDDDVPAVIAAVERAAG